MTEKKFKKKTFIKYFTNLLECGELGNDRDRLHSWDEWLPMITKKKNVTTLCYFVRYNHSTETSECY